MPGTCIGFPTGRDVVVEDATANVELTEAWREFGNSGGGWENEGGWAAADGTYSTLLPGKQVVWLFNDTWLGPVNDDESLGDSPGLVNNSAVLGGRDGLPDLTITGGTRDDPTSLAGPLWQWNGDGIVDDGKLQVFEYEQGPTDDPPPFNFAWIGTTLVTFDKDFDIDAVTTVPMDGDVAWGVDVVRCGQFLYIYGVESVWLDKHMHVARTRVGHLADIDSWTYFTGETWTSDPGASARVAREMGASYSVTPVEGKWVLTTSDSLLGDTIYVSVADSPTGPFDGRQAVYVAPEAHSGEGLYAPYNIAAHPAISKPGTLTISYNVNASGGLDVIKRNANFNRPRFVDIHLITQ
ncbi:DUF4185 domain-containing protein [Actinopolymorpha sp. B17G11]|uniref:DUF4185 domain-containing protein n=1 Tax=Actinopolymorpha sp. B17G11 TaxID=3160861 RepID=UPI0032E4B0F7